MITLLLKILDENVYKVLPLASEYQVEKLKRRSEKVLLGKIKQHFMKNALELYRHIKLAELYEMDELKQACIYAASDLKLPDLKGARSVHSISLENDLMIKELAIEKHELDKADDLQLDVLSQKPAAQQSSSQTTVNPDRYFHDFLWGRMSNPQNPSEGLRSARLWKRYFPSADNNGVLRKLKEMQVKNCKDFEDEFKLLPEEIKQAIL
jgi:hypothetical protein